MINTAATRSTPPKPRARRDAAGVSPYRVLAMTVQVFDDDLHARAGVSLSTAVLEVLEAATLGVHAIGRGLAVAKSLNQKPAIQQFDQ